MEKIDLILKKLQRSKFRSGFHLKQGDFNYIDKRGLDVIRKHACHFIEKRLAPAEIKNDGRQTPMRGHPVFIAQHATATCCRKCLEKWYQIKKNRELSEKEIDFVVAVIMRWIKKEIDLLRECRQASDLS